MDFLDAAGASLGSVSTGSVTGGASTVRFALSEPAAVTLHIERLAGGRRCANGTLRRSARAGGNRVRVSGRIGRRALRRGRYHLTVRATDGAGNRSAAAARSSVSSADPDPAPRRVAPEEDTRTSSLGLPRLRDGTAVA